MSTAPTPVNPSGWTRSRKVETCLIIDSKQPALGVLTPEEKPIANPPLTDDERSAVSRLKEEDFKAIDTTILANSSHRWLKVARVVSFTQDQLQNAYPDLSCVFYAQRLCQLVDEGQLESQGDLSYMRFSEVRLPAPPDSFDAR